MTVTPTRPSGVSAATLGAIAAAASELDARPAFPTAAFQALTADGALEMVGEPRAREWEAVRAVARADGSAGRLYEGHLNAAERLAIAAPEPLRTSELAAIRAGELWLGVWGADPAPGEGEPARSNGAGSSARRRSAPAPAVSTARWCSPAAARGPPSLVYVDLEDAEVDDDWFRAGGMRASVSHRVRFDTDVLAVLGEPGELGREPWFSRDAMRPPPPGPGSPTPPRTPRGRT